MNCVRPPLLKKPSRGFAWACGPCSRAQERKLEARNTPNLMDTGLEVEEEELLDEEEEDGFIIGDGGDTGRTSPTRSTDADVPIHPGTAEQIHQASLWPFRYLGIHCKVEDALDYDDRIYPRASSRLGPRHQANVTIWHGKPVELVKRAEIKKRYIKGSSHKKDAKLSKETIAALEADKMARDKRPKWVMDEPPGYVRRGEDYDKDDPENTAELLFKPPEAQGRCSPDPRSQLTYLTEATGPSANQECLIDDYLDRAKLLAPQIGVQAYSVNFLDKALIIFCSKNYDAEAALRELSTVTKKDLKEPELTAGEIKKFEDGVAKYGSELHSVKKHVKTVSAANIVRFYYIWKKTERGKQVWGNYAGRKGKKEAKKAEANAGKLQDDVADDHDDSAFDNDKAMEKKRGFQCKFCLTRTSRQWRRAPNTPAGTTVSVDSGNKSSSKDKGAQLMVALCLNCAVIWRKYAVQWEDGDDHGKKAAQNGGRGNKRKADDSLREFQLNEISWTTTNTDTATTPTGGTPIPQTSGLPPIQEQARKRVKGIVEKDQVDSPPQDPGSLIGAVAQKKKAIDKQAGPLPAPDLPKPKILPCSICLQMDPMGDQHISCRECRMTVHRNCYGMVGETRSLSKWVCDTCSNDRNPQVSIVSRTFQVHLDFG
jgi:PHD-finger